MQKRVLKLLAEFANELESHLLHTWTFLFIETMFFCSCYCNKVKSPWNCIESSLELFWHSEMAVLTSSTSHQGSTKYSVVVFLFEKRSYGNRVIIFSACSSEIWSRIVFIAIWKKHLSPRDKREPSFMPCLFDLLGRSVIVRYHYIHTWCPSVRP